MKGIKLFLQLKSLSKEEMKLLRKAVSSPYFNSNPSVILLFEKLRLYHPNFDESPRGKRKLFKKMFPNEAFNDGKLRRLFTFLSQVVEKFLIFEELENDTRQEQELLVRIYEKRNVQYLFEHGIERLLTNHEEAPIKSTEWYHQHFHLLLDRYSNLNHAKYNLKDDTLDRAARSLDSYFALQKLQLAISQKNREKILNKVPYYGFLRLPEGEDIPDNKLFQLYFQSHNLLTEEMAVDFLAYEKLLFENHLQLSIKDKLVLFYNGLNYLVRQSNKGNYTFDAFIFGWYQWGLQEELFTQNGQMSAITFSNIILYACIRKEFDWINDFIDKYSAYLNKEYRVDEVAYCQSVVLFYKREFTSAIFQLSNYEFSNRYVLKTKNLISLTYFELFTNHKETYFDLLESTLKTYENYLYRNASFNEKLLKPHLNFIQIVKGWMMKIQNNASLIEMVKWLEKQIGQRGGIANKKWLTERLILMQEEADLGMLKPN